MDEGYFLTLLSILMFVASYGTGFIPLTLTFSEVSPAIIHWEDGLYLSVKNQNNIMELEFFCSPSFRLSPYSVQAS